MLNDWGIHHLHLGTSLKNGFAKRTGAVLFARFTDETAFFINVLDHSKNASLQPWFDQALVRILHKNWPESISQFRVYGVQIPPSHSYDTIKESREDKIEVAGETAIRISKGNTYVSVEDAVYVLIGGGYTTDGTSMEAVIQTKSHVQAIKNLEKYIRSNYLQLMSLVEKKSIFPSSRFKFRLVINASNVVVVEEVSQQTWPTQLKFKDGMLKNSR